MSGTCIRTYDLAHLFFLFRMLFFGGGKVGWFYLLEVYQLIVFRNGAKIVFVEHSSLKKIHREFLIFRSSVMKMCLAERTNDRPSIRDVKKVIESSIEYVKKVNSTLIHFHSIVTPNAY